LVTNDDLNARVSDAVRFFWRTRNRQGKQQGLKSGRKDAGNRSSVTGGKQLDGFVALCRDLVVAAGVEETQVFWQTKRQVPGFYRAEKNWDLVVVARGHLLAIVEFKSQVGSLGNNCNNRMEEAIGNATDLWAAYREGAFRNSVRPWLGYVVLLEDTPKAHSPVKVCQPHYDVFPEFVGASYALRYQLLLRRLLTDRLYDGACFLTSAASAGRTGSFNEPDPMLSFSRFAAGLTSHSMAFSRVE
jgi:hypothetical protein